MSSTRADRAMTGRPQRRGLTLQSDTCRQPDTGDPALSVGLVGLPADAEAEEGRVARPRAAERFQVCPRKARGREADAVAEQKG
jgi:hypothetical protein